jgi:argininosuccinate lyase
MLETATFHRERMRASLKGDFSNATDLADDLARNGVPFREAHEIVGRVVLHCLKAGIALEEMSLEALRAFHPSIDEDTLARLPHEAAMRARASRGGTAPDAVRAQIKKARERLAGRPLECQSRA